MKIGLLGPYPAASGKPVGGVQAAVAALAHSLPRVGQHEVRVFDPFTGYPTHPDDRDVVRLERLSAWRGAVPLVPHDLQRAIDDFDADLLHVHLGAQYTRAHPVSLLTVHGFPHLETRMRNPGPRGRLSGMALRPAFAFGVAHARAVIAISEEVVRTARAQGVPSVNIPNPVAEIFFEVERSNAQHFIAVGDIMRRKNQAVLIEAFSEYVRRGGDGKLLIIGGIHDPDYYATCRHAAATCPGRVVFTGPVSQARLAALMAEARAWVSTSLRETSSIALAEALAANCPVLSLDVGTAAMQVRSSDAGRVLPLNAGARDIAEALHQISGLTGDGLRDLVRGQHPHEVARRTVEAYRAALAKGSTAASRI